LALASAKVLHCFGDSIGDSEELLETNLFFPKSPKFQAEDLLQET
jgi:hypothetical protein